MKYKFKRAGKEIIIELTECSIIYKETFEKKIEIPFIKIKNINSNIKTKNKKKCKVTSFINNTITIYNESKNDNGEYTINIKNYNQLIEKLHESTIKHKQIKYSVGSSFIRYFFIIFFTSTTIIFTILLILSLKFPSKVDFPLSPFLTNLIMIPGLIHYIKNYNSGPYFPNKIPKIVYSEKH